MFRDQRSACVCPWFSVHVLQRKTTNTPIVEQVARTEKGTMKTCRVSGTVRKGFITGSGLGLSRLGRAPTSKLSGDRIPWLS